MSFIVEAKRSNEDIEEIWEALVGYINLNMLSKIQKIKGPVAFPKLHQILRDGYYHANGKYLIKQHIWNLTYQIKIQEENRSLGREKLVQPCHFLLSFLLPFFFP